MKTSKAEIVREYGPFPETERVNGVIVRRQACLDRVRRPAEQLRPGERQEAALARRCRACGHRVRRRASVPDRREPHPEDRSEERTRARLDSGARQRRRFRTGLGGRHAVGRPVPGAQDPPDRPGDRSDPAHHPIRPLRHRRHLGRRRAVARRLGERGERASPHRSADRRACWRRIEMPRGVVVSGLESNGSDQFFCGGGTSGKVRVVRKPK